MRRALPLIALLLTLLAHPVLAQEQELASLELLPADDAHVAFILDAPAELPLAELEAGLLPILRVGYAWNATTGEHTVTIAYIKFNLTALAGLNFTGAYLELYAAQVELGGPRGVDVYVAESSDWSERQLTFSNRPRFSPNATAQGSVSTGSRWYTWDVTQASRSRAGGLVTLVVTLRTLTPGGRENISFNSREAQENRPRLRVDYLKPPENPNPSPSAALYAGAATILGIALLALRHQRRARKQGGAAKPKPRPAARCILPNISTR